ncbi:MAG: S1C family serine protease [candidate division KSB1 bacterium]|nr:S1C family serine protease [candidate division KSB1 bacterium]MDZ7317727.1 S1C family serine protease [candidate division KSB1 bacterium]MDZ7340240.1 S1C family serine protease [candidate division KSB1 bacterium]
MKIYFAISAAILWFIASSCSPTGQQLNVPSPKIEEGPPAILQKLEASIIKITCSAYYEIQYYAPPPPNASVSQQSLLTNKKFTTNSVAGTGLIIFSQAKKILVLTCEHIFSFQDTIRTYYADENNQPTNYLQSLAIRFGQTSYVTHRDGTSSRATLVVADTTNDVAVLETEAAANELSEFPFQERLAKKTDIRLGQEIYLLGYPKGIFMVTRGLATPSKYKTKFVADLTFNRGFSGGVAIAYNTNSRTFEYIGMATAASYDSELVLAPPEGHHVSDQNMKLPYQDDVYLKELRLINYGITFITKSEVIVDFLSRSSEKLKQYGYYHIEPLIK